MDLTNIELNGATITGITQQDGKISIRFEPAYLIKSMTGSEERTRWRQNVALVFDQAELQEGADLELPAICIGGDVGENIYTYRDMIPVPLKSHGRASCTLSLEGTEQRLQISAVGVELVVDGSPKYVEHIRL